MEESNDVRGSFVVKLSGLRDRFTRIAAIADEGNGNREVEAACAWSGNLLLQMDANGILPMGLPRPEPTGMFADGFLLGQLMAWKCGVQVLSHVYPELFPSNPVHVRWQTVANPEGAEAMRVGAEHRADWRIRAENFALICDVLSTEIGDPTESDNENAQKKTRWFFVHTLLDNEPGNDDWQHADKRRFVDRYNANHATNGRARLTIAKLSEIQRGRRKRLQGDDE
jgi:hypothetical protein